jgi:hypothetical protein
MLTIVSRSSRQLSGVHGGHCCMLAYAVLAMLAAAVLPLLSQEPQHIHNVGGHGQL